MFENKNNKNTQCKLLVALAVIVVLATAIFGRDISDRFKGQLNLSKTGEQLFTTGGSGSIPTFKVCDTKSGTCQTKETTDAIVRFKLPNGEFLNQISLENATFGNYQLVVEADKQNTVKVAKKGTDTEIKLGAAQKPYDLTKDDAVYVKDTTGINIKLPNSNLEKGYDIFNLGYPIKQSEDINILTYENRTQDNTGEIFIAYPEFMEKRVDGEKMAKDIIEMADRINEKIATQLKTPKAEYYLIITPSAIAPDFYRTTYYTASGMAYPRLFEGTKAIKPKYGINLEKTFTACAIDKDYPAKKCYEDPKNMKYLEYLLTHEFGHIYQYNRTGTGEKLKGSSEAFLEAATEINTAFVISPMNPKEEFLKKVKAKEKCNAQPDNHNTGFCMAAYFIEQIDKDSIARLFTLDKTYDFTTNKKSKQYCETWFSIMQYVTGKNLNEKKADFQKNICQS